MLGIFQDIAALNAGGMKFGTSATRKILNGLGSPDKKPKIIHIAGTNGKGAVAEYMTEILLAAGKTVGTFTSPKVVNYFDQFRIDGKPIDERTLARYFKRAYDLRGDATGFEVETAGALYAFAESNCEYAVIECGLGGLNDATNAVESKQVAIITSISLEHTSVLGGTIEEICAHKAGIIKNCPAVVCALQTDTARKFFERIGAKIADDGLKILSAEKDGVRFLYGGEEYFTKMPASCYAYDAAAAIEAAKLLEIDKNAIHMGIFSARTKGRLQISERGGTEYIVDGGHNPAAVKYLAELLGKYKKEDVTLIYGCLSDKDIGGVLENLKDSAAKIIAVPCPGPRAMDMERTAAECKKYFAVTEVCGGVCEALEKAKGVVAVCGTFTTVEEALNWIEKRQ